MAAVVVLLAACGAALGGLKYGPRGAAVGFLLTGAAVNTARAVRSKSDPDPAVRSEALWSGIYAACGLAAGGWLAYQLHERAAA